MGLLTQLLKDITHPKILSILANALGDDENFSTTVNTALGNRITKPNAPTSGHYLKWDGTNWVAAAVASGGQSQLVTSHSVNVGPSSISYISISGISSGEDFATFCVAPRAMTVSKLYVKTSDAQHSGGTQVVTIRKNGVDTALTLTIAANAAAGIFSNTTNSFTVNAGDVITIKAQNNSGGSSAATLRNISMVVE